MQIARPSVTLFHYTHDLERTIERMGAISCCFDHEPRTCSACGGTGRRVLDESACPRSCCASCARCGGVGTDVESARDFIRRILRSDDGAVVLLKHVSAGFQIAACSEVVREVARCFASWSCGSFHTRIRTASTDEVLVVTANFFDWREHLRRARFFWAHRHPLSREIADEIHVELIKISAACFEDLS